MNYLKQFCDHLVDYLHKKDVTAVDKFQAWSENGQLVMNGKAMGRGVEMGMWRYDLVIQIEDIPTTKINTTAIFARALAWLHEQDEYRHDFGLSDPSVDLDSYRDRSIVSLEMRVPMIEPISLLESNEEHGDVYFAGKWFVVEQYEYDVAEDGDVIGGKDD